MEKRTLTLSQKQIFDMTQIEDGDYSISAIATFQGRGNVEYMKTCLETLYENNQIFHVSFDYDGVEMKQYLDEEKSYTVQVNEFPSWEKFEQWKANVETLAIDYQHLFDLYGFTIGEQEFGLYIRMHHIISDATSIGIVICRFNDLYHAALGEREFELVCGDFMAALEEHEAYRNSEKYQKDRDYWFDEFQGVNEPSKITEKRATKHDVSRISIRMNEHELQVLNRFTSTTKDSLFHAYMAAFAVYLSRMNRMEEVNIATTIHNRFGKNLKSTVGMFADTILYRISVNPDDRYADMIAEVKQKIFASLKHSRFNYTETKKELLVKNNNQLELLDVIINYQVVHKSFQDDVDVRWQNCKKQFNSLTVNICDWENNGQFSIDYDYLDCVLTEKEIRTMHRQIMNIMMSGMEKPDTNVRGIELVDQFDYDVYRKINEKFDVAYPEMETIVSLFEKQVELRDEETALIYDQKEYSYAKLNQKANMIAQNLIQSGVKPGDYVAFISDRTVDILYGIIGIIKAGAVYVPMDPNYPEERIQYMIEDCLAKAVLLATENEIKISHENVLNVKSFDTGKTYENPNVQINPEDELYVIYTSGTTGKPKGVPICHSNVVRLLFNDEFQFQFSEKDTWLLFHYYGFDFSVWEMYGALLYGGKLVVPSLEETRDVFAIIRLIKDNQITVLNQVPSAFYALMLGMDKERIDSLRYLIFGGEMLDPRKLAEWKQYNPQVRIINMYGITETTVHVTYKEIGDEEIASGISDIGLPIPTLGIYLLQGEQLCGVGMPGELCVYGAGLSSGYLNRNELTKEKFVSIPKLTDKMIYRSGDLARIQENGSIEYLGRIDQQVKISGFRIELKEIENAILKQNQYDIKECVVIDRIDNGGKRNLFAYLVYQDRVDFSLIKKEIKQVLPSYMIPMYWTTIEKIPITKNGKLDRNSLPDIETPIMNTFVEPGNEKEAKILEIFRNVLGYELLGITDDFFEYGGDSIKSMMFVAKCKEIGYEITSKEIVSNPTVEAIASLCRELSGETGENEDVKGPVKATPIYEYFKEMKLPNETHYNQAVLLQGMKPVQTEWVEQAMGHLVEHHDVLRAKWADGSLRIQEKDRAHEFVDVTTVSINGTKNMEQACNEVQKSISFEHGSLCKAVILSTGDGDYLLFVAHHLVIDGVSWRILLDDFVQLYEECSKGIELQLPAKTTSVQTWAEALEQYANSSGFTVENQYWNTWLEQFETENHRKVLHGTDGVTQHRILLDKREMNELLLACREVYGMDANVVYMTAFMVALCDLTKRKRIMVSLEGHGREVIQEGNSLDRTVGWFTSIFPVVLDLKDTIQNTMVHVKDTVKMASLYQLGYGIKKYILHEKMNDFVPDVMFNYLGDVGATLKENEFFALSDLDLGEMCAKENKDESLLTINGFTKADSVLFELEYGNAQYSKSDIEKLEKNVMDVLEQMKTLCFGKHEKVITVSDVSTEQIAEDEWDELCAMYNA